MNYTPSLAKNAALAVGLALGSATAQANLLLTVNVHNLANPTGVAVGGLHVGFHRGVFDGFNAGTEAGTAIVPVAELGSGSAWLPALAAADPTATRGTVGGVVLPGQSSSATFVVNPLQNPFFSYAAMVVPSNDHFIGNDSPTALRLFNAAGELAITNLTLKASQIWDAGSETFDPAAAAFVGNAALRTAEQGVVTTDFAEFAKYDGLTTAAGYSFTSGLRADTDFYRIDFSATQIPEPGAMTLALTGLLLGGAATWRRRKVGPQHHGAH